MLLLSTMFLIVKNGGKCHAFYHVLLVPIRMQGFIEKRTSLRKIPICEGKLLTVPKSRDFIYIDYALAFLFFLSLLVKNLSRQNMMPYLFMEMHYA